MPKEILLGLTTTPGSDWRRKCEEIDELGLKRIALFPTFLGVDDRKELYSLLENTGIEEIPHIHLRSDDMEAWEMKLFESRYRTRFYNIHSVAIDVPQFQSYFHKIYVENHYELLPEDILKRCAGLCLDFSHLEDIRATNPLIYESYCGLLGKYAVGCCHVSSVPFAQVSDHFMHDLHELDYLVRYQEYLPDLISLEMENSFHEQLQAKAYIEKILKLI